ncbi:unnamed protein product, partial [Mesorhabditis spiculigera]
MSDTERPPVLDQDRVANDFLALLRGDSYLSSGIAAIRVLYDILNNTDASTTFQVIAELESATSAMANAEQASLCVLTACEIFTRYVTLTPSEILDNRDFRVVLGFYRNRAYQFLQRSANSPNFIARIACAFMPRDGTVLVHSYSKVVLRVLATAKMSNSIGSKFRVFVTESRPDFSGRRMYEELVRHGFDATLILDVSVGSLMSSVDVVLIGAEGVLETGGIINKMGTLNITDSAKVMNKPVYVVAESIKFVKKAPMSKREITHIALYPQKPINMSLNITEARDASGLFRRFETDYNNDDKQNHYQQVDYSPPTNINLIITDLGIFPPEAVGGELVKLYA